MKIAVLKGDCIGPEITASAAACVEAVSSKFGLGIVQEEHPVGFEALEKFGTTYPDETHAACEKSDAIILGPVHTYAYPEHINPSAAVRKRFDLFANLRPAKSYPGVPCVGKPMDLVIARENTEGFYADRNMFMGSGEFMPTPDVALAVRKITAASCARISQTAFELAQVRRRKVTIVTKANVLKMSEGLFKREAEKVAANFPDIEFDEVLIDAMAAMLVRDPGRFDVVLTTNMYGDILSDEAAELTGGLGLGGSINAGHERAVAQAAHGAAPDIAGQDRANPTALVLSCAQLLEWLGARSSNNALIEAGACIMGAVETALSDPANRTADLGGKAGTKAYTAALVKAIEAA